MIQNRTEKTERLLKTAEGIIFDVDGTLLNSMHVWMEAGEKYLNSLNIEAEEGLGEKLFTMTFESAADYLIEHYKLNENRDTIVKQVIHMVEEEYFYKIPKKPYVSEFLELLKQHNIPVAVATTSNRRVVEAAFKRLGIFDYFGKIFTCSEVGAGKDKPDIYFRAAEFLGCHPEKIWVFEDAVYAAQTAKQAGFWVTGIFDSSSMGQQEKLKETVDIYIKDFSEFFV